MDHGTGDTELDHGPVVGLGVVPAGLPAIVPGTGMYEHSGTVDWGCRREEIGGRGEVVVGAGEDGGVES